MSRLALISCSNKRCRLRLPAKHAKPDPETHALYCADCFENRANFSDEKPAPTTLAKQYWEIILRQKPRPQLPLMEQGSWD